MPTKFQLNLQPASFRGVPFEVVNDRIGAGRRVAVHEYPFRDMPYAEDIGRRARRIPVTGYVIGDDAPAQAQSLLDACEQKGPGILVLPTMGMFQVLCASSESEERWDEQRYVEFRIEFVEAGELLYPSSAKDSQDTTASAADNAAGAASQDYSNGPSGDTAMAPRAFSSREDAEGYALDTGKPAVFRNDGGGATLINPGTNSLSSAPSQSEAFNNAVATGQPTAYSVNGGKTVGIVYPPS